MSLCCYRAIKIQNPSFSYARTLCQENLKCAHKITLIRYVGNYWLFHFKNFLIQREEKNRIMIMKQRLFRIHFVAIPYKIEKYQKIWFNQRDI